MERLRLAAIRAPLCACTCAVAACTQLYHSRCGKVEWLAGEGKTALTGPREKRDQLMELPSTHALSALIGMGSALEN